jgi:hypothetical protein
MDKPGGFITEGNCNTIYRPSRSCFLPHVHLKSVTSYSQFEMAISWSGRFSLALVVIGFAAIFANPKLALNLFAGRLATLSENTAYLNHGSLNNEKCWTEPS